ncbi:MAG: hypothetical protein BWY28_02148 [bacterium ADurb.Bin236]|nr:MAG: hypothetical protein BWY28_02148 [bacterium ADurb.Bin236]
MKIVRRTEFTEMDGTLEEIREAGGAAAVAGVFGLRERVKSHVVVVGGNGGSALPEIPAQRGEIEETPPSTTDADDYTAEELAEIMSSKKAQRGDAPRPAGQETPEDIPDASELILRNRGVNEADVMKAGREQAARREKVKAMADRALEKMKKKPQSHKATKGKPRGRGARCADCGKMFPHYSRLTKCPDGKRRCADCLG